MADDFTAKSDFLLYTSPDGDVKVDVFFEDETVWLTQKRMAELFGVDVRTVNDHLLNIFEIKELDADRTIRKIRIVQHEGTRKVEREVNFYNLDAIISVGYRVNSQQATQFRIWATKTLRNFIIKGFALDSDRLKNGSHFGKDYFDELLEQIREIRASERRFYQKVTDIYATAIDYDRNAPVTRDFYATMQNKLHWAIHGQTAAELIASRADAKKPHMGLQTWRDSPKGKILKSDVSVGKNYLGDTQLQELNRVVTMYLDYAENQAQRRLPMKMADWASKLDAFLQFNEYEILKDPGKVSMAAAKKLAEKEFETFRVAQDKEFESDFDEAVKNIKPTEG
ncbi:cell filamentation protein Fic [Candidatus Saccharibacteria bacterium RIFCSPHIGHO2_01_FULL_45_15]|nr:MAG: cell filamentation protein Fic [Candidatus Saccharibacteria bacterium RIFCSPHIGHO2_01_FULL_45_15]OGL27129.1 MAG: cell filamentation protein Fic [Candidatus Saccharibacteria bacterium RIFCSPHIGHO2_02_FULL_46_12]OGL31542.1 MAG: cell filamentation protein Fic [Candidatus Saccharibacteria bacterium RIFCSPHIGHO2_12_FULL_44_22]